MSLWKVAWRSIRQRSLVSLLTVLSMGLGVALVVAVALILYLARIGAKSGCVRPKSVIFFKKSCMAGISVF